MVVYFSSVFVRFFCTPVEEFYLFDFVSVVREDDKFNRNFI